MKAAILSAVRSFLKPAPPAPAAPRKVEARYEAAVYSPTRSGVWWPMQDARVDADRWSRAELARLGWHLYQNSPLIRALIERLVTYTIGTGINPAACSSDEEWNRAADDLWRERSRCIELTAGLSWGQYIDQACRCAFVAGDCLSVFVDAGGEFRLSLLEAHHIDTTKATPGCRDGVVTDASGCVTGYTRRDTGEEYPADLAVLHWFPERPGQYRGVSLLASAINTARDVDDILALEKLCVKEASATTEVIESTTGDVPGVEAAYAASTWTSPDGVERDSYYLKRFGAAPKILQPGDKYVKTGSDRPSPAWQGFVDFLAQTICLSTGLPPSMLYGDKVGGADTRRELATAQRVIDRFQFALSCQFDRIWRHQVALAIGDGPLRGAPSDWRRVEWQFPKAITVDSGREAAQDREDVRSGLLSRREYHGRWGTDWRDHEAQIDAEARERIARAKQLSADEGINFDAAMNLLGAWQNTPPVPAGQPAPPAPVPSITPTPAPVPVSDPSTQEEDP